MLSVETESQEAQEDLGRRIALAVKGDCVIYLHGELGAGKTTLVRGFLRGLGHQGSVRSPTYTLMEPYQTDAFSVYHLDLYRLADAGELEYLGVRDFLGTGAVLLVEWPERGEGDLPPADLLVEIEYRGTGRRLRLVPCTEAGRSIQDALEDAVS